MQGVGADLQDRCITRTITGRPYQWFDHRTSLDFVVVAADDLGPAGDIGVGQQGMQNRRVTQLLPLWGRNAGWLPGGGEHPLRAPVVEHLHGNIDQHHIVVGDHQAPAAIKCAYRRGFDFFGSTTGQQGGQMLWWYGHHDALLRFGEPDFPRLQTGIFQGDLGQFYPGAGLFAHFADGRRQPAGATIGDGAVQAGVTGLDDHVDQLFFGNGIANLHRTARFLGSGVGEFNR